MQGHEVSSMMIKGKMFKLFDHYQVKTLSKCTPVSLAISNRKVKDTSKARHLRAHCVDCPWLWPHVLAGIL